MIIKLTRRSPMNDFDKQIVYLNTDHISDFYKTWKNINDIRVAGTHINMTDGSIFVSELPETILQMIQPTPLYLDTDKLTEDQRKLMYKELLNGVYGTVIQPTCRDFNDKMTPLS